MLSGGFLPGAAAVKKNEPFSNYLVDIAGSIVYR